MCGICGFTHAEIDDMPILKGMCDVIAHRGPDGEGQYIADGIALGHRRLSLIDLEGGSQPMFRQGIDGPTTTVNEAGRIEGAGMGSEGAGDRDGEAKAGATEPSADVPPSPYAIVFNGEIYNFRDLRAELEAQGWTFSTNSDTEVLLVGYMAWGPEVLQRLRGMFAFAIWDPKERKLFCARDPFGIKPFYYTQQPTQAGKRFIFASESKGILEHPAYERRVNEEALEAYLCFQFSALKETMFEGIFKLNPAHYLIVGDDGIEQDVRYWRPSYPTEDSSLEDFVDRIDQTMHDSVSYHNVADVEVGSFLSSGIDSSYMAACLGQINPNIKTFTVGFSEYEGERDEISWARELADELGLSNRSKHITKEEYWDALEKIQWHMDEPSGDPSAVALYFVDQLAAEDVKAVLSGEGADEFFAGYKIYQAPLANDRLSWVPKPMLRGMSKAARTLGVRGANYLERASEGVKDWYYTNANGVAFTKDEADDVLLNPKLKQTPQQITASTYAEAEASDLDQVTQMQYADLFFWLVGDILLKTDKMSMAHSLESRVPFLDREVFSISSKIPVYERLDLQQTKIPLRLAAERNIPKDWAQKEKLGFPVPIVNWLREDEYYDRIKRAFTGDVAAKYFDTDKLVAILDEHRAGKDNSRKIWIVYMFLLWHHAYFE